MRYLTLALVLVLALTSAHAKDAKFTFEPGKSLGPVAIGQTLDDVLVALAGWSYSINPYVAGHVYSFPKEPEEQFSCGFTPGHRLEEITLDDSSFVMKGSPSIRPGCSKADIQAAFGKPSTNTLSEFGGYWDYNTRGLCFHFPGNRNPPRYGKDKVESISLYAPGTSRFESTSQD